MSQNEIKLTAEQECALEELKKAENRLAAMGFFVHRVVSIYGTKPQIGKTTFESRVFSHISNPEVAGKLLKSIAYNVAREAIAKLWFDHGEDVTIPPDTEIECKIGDALMFGADKVSLDKTLRDIQHKLDVLGSNVAGSLAFLASILVGDSEDTPKENEEEPQAATTEIQISVATQNDNPTPPTEQEVEKPPVKRWALLNANTVSLIGGSVCACIVRKSSGWEAKRQPAIQDVGAVVAPEFQLFPSLHEAKTWVEETEGKPDPILTPRLLWRWAGNDTYPITGSEHAKVMRKADKWVATRGEWREAGVNKDNVKVTTQEFDSLLTAKLWVEQTEGLPVAVAATAEPAVKTPDPQAGVMSWTTDPGYSGTLRPVNGSRFAVVFKMANNDYTAFRRKADDPEQSESQVFDSVETAKRWVEETELPLPTAEAIKDEEKAPQPQVKEGEWTPRLLTPNVWILNGHPFACVVELAKNNFYAMRTTAGSDHLSEIGSAISLEAAKRWVEETELKPAGAEGVQPKKA